MDKINLKEIVQKNKGLPNYKVYELNKEIIDKVIDKLYLFENVLTYVEFKRISRVFFPLSCDLWYDFINDLPQRSSRPLEELIAEEIVNYFR